MHFGQISDSGKLSVFGTSLNLGLTCERIAQELRHEKNFRNKFSTIAFFSFYAELRFKLDKNYWQ
jgi:hypothetical protein